MSKPESPDHEQPIHVKLTEAERSLILGLKTINLEEVEEWFEEAEVTDETVEILLSHEDLDLLLQHIAFAADRTEEQKLLYQLVVLFEKLDCQLAEG